MTDERFWHVYFTLVAKYLPEKAYNWVEGDLLPYKPGERLRVSRLPSRGRLLAQLC